MLRAQDIRERYLHFFTSRGHVQVPSAPLVPENDPTTLFTSSGMQPLVPNLLGQPHPSGTKLVNSQKCFRSQDIEEVGDNRHTTFFEMLGNWSLGEYFKSDQLKYFFNFLTDENEGLGLDPNKLYVTVFSGDQDFNVPADTQSIEVWQLLFASRGIAAKAVMVHTEAEGAQKGMGDYRIFGYGVKKNWWSRSGVPKEMPEGEPGGPDSEVFYDFGTPHNPKYGPMCHPNCDCGRFLEIGNSVFMQYKKMVSGQLEEMPQKNVDFGGGLERLAAAVSGNPDIFTTSLYAQIISEVEHSCGKRYGSESESTQAMRIVADHLKASVFLIADGVTPSNKGQGYFLRRLLRRAMVKLQELKGDISLPVESNAYLRVCEAVVNSYQDTAYFSVVELQYLKNIIAQERDRFSQTLKAGLKKIGDISSFDLFQTYGFPPEVTEELYKQKGLEFNWQEFEEQLKKHQDLSRTASSGMFKGGLQDQSEATTKYHTATHLLHKALRDLLGPHVQQKGSNITADRLRFDFSHTQKLSPHQIQAIEEVVNTKIQEDLPVSRVEMPKSQALAEGALAFFPEKYPAVTSVYTVGEGGNVYSKELCGGPHVASTGLIGKIKIVKEESAGAGVRRIYAQLAE